MDIIPDYRTLFDAVEVEVALAPLRLYDLSVSYKEVRTVRDLMVA